MVQQKRQGLGIWDTVVVSECRVPKTNAWICQKSVKVKTYPKRYYNVHVDFSLP